MGMQLIPMAANRLAFCSAKVPSWLSLGQNVNCS